MNSCTRKARILRYLFVRIQKQCKGLRNKIWTWIVLSPNSTPPPPPSVAIHFSSVFIYIKLSFSTQTHISSIFIYNDSCSFQNIPMKISSRRVDEEMRREWASKLEHVGSVTTWTPQAPDHSLPTFSTCSGEEGHIGALFPYNSDTVAVCQEKDCLVLIPSLSQVSLAKMLKNNSTKYFFPYEPLDKQKQRKEDRNWKRTIITVHFMHLCKHTASPANL